MKQVPFVFAVALLLVGCGSDTMTAAATAAALKKQEIEQGRQTMDRTREKINAATDLMQQKARTAADAAE